MQRLHRPDRRTAPGGALLPLLLVVGLACVGCDDGGTTSNDTAGGDTSVSSDTSTTDGAADTSSGDTGQSNDTATVDDTASGDTGADTSSGDCTYNGFETAIASASWVPQDGFFIYESVTADPGAGDPYDSFALEIYEDTGGEVVPFTRELTFEGYDTCGTCVILRQNCVQGQECPRAYMATQGRLEVTDISKTDGELFHAVWTDLVLEEVQIDSQTFATTIVPDGDVWCIDRFEGMTSVNEVQP